MNLSIIIVSFLAIVFMLLFKIREERTGRQSSFSRFFSRGDQYIAKFVILAKHVGNITKDRAVFMVLVRVPSRIEKFFALLKRRSLAKYDSIYGKMRGERTFTTNASASPFMRTLASRNSDRR